MSWFLAWIAWCTPLEVPVATLNIEHFPRSEVQVRAALDEIGSLGVPVVAVQEITDPERLRSAARVHLGPTWRFVTHEDRRGAHRVGLLFDGARLELDALVAHDSVRVVPGGRPALEVRLVGAPTPLRVFVVHLKAGEGWLDVRRQQLEVLTRVVQAATRTDDDVIVLGDFNSVLAADRVRLMAFSRATGLPWASAGLGCTALRSDRGACEGTALDHLFGQRRIKVAGPCAERCRWEGACPPYVGRVSDHCAVLGIDPRATSGWALGGGPLGLPPQSPQTSSASASSTSSCATNEPPS